MSGPQDGGSGGKGELERAELRLHNCSQHLRAAHAEVGTLKKGRQGLPWVARSWKEVVGVICGRRCWVGRGHWHEEMGHWYGMRKWGIGMRK
eukprot:428658-Rhodomonas_salina.7